ALKQLGWPATKTVNVGGGVDKDLVFNQAGDSADGAYFSYGFDSWDNTKNVEVAVYRKAMQKYKNASGQQYFAQFAFANLMTIYNAAKTLKNPTAASLHAFFV